MPENPASYRVVRTKSYLFNKAGLDMSKIAALQRVSPRTAAYHKNKIMEKYSLNNNHEFFQFMNLLRERW
ncbi:hypothetical protein nublan011_44450 [Klebsiella pneumoniae]